MNVPKVLRKQIAEYQRAGFTPVSIEARSGAHFKIVFEGMSKPFFVSKNGSDARAVHNNIAALRRVAKELA